MSVFLLYRHIAVTKRQDTFEVTPTKINRHQKRFVNTFVVETDYTLDKILKLVTTTLNLQFFPPFFDDSNPTREIQISSYNFQQRTISRALFIKINLLLFLNQKK